MIDDVSMKNWLRFSFLTVRFDLQSISSLTLSSLAMPTVHEILPGKITLDIECVDRVYLNGYVKNLQMPGGVINFIREQFGWPIPSPKGMYLTSDKFRQAVEQYATAQGLKIYAFSKSEDKDEVRLNTPNVLKPSTVLF